MLNLTHNILALFAFGTVVAAVITSVVGLAFVIWWIPDHRIREFDERSWIARHWRIFVAVILFVGAAFVLFNNPSPLG